MHFINSIVEIKPYTITAIFDHNEQPKQNMPGRDAQLPVWSYLEKAPEDFCIRIVKDYGFIEDRGLGIRWKVLPILRPLEFYKPLFENSENNFKVTILKKI